MNPEVVHRMRDAMVHRGPDDSGIYLSTDRRVALAHRRLSIVDTSPRGRQPMPSEDGSVVVVQNGEIYNHLELRTWLEERGHRFYSNSDSEVIVHAYEEHGDDCVARLDGMFAFGLWDARQRRLLIARDRLGKKPLYWGIFGGRLLFASEIKALLAHPDVPRELDLDGLDLYLSFSSVPPPRTLLRGIHKLAPGHVLTCDAAGNVSVQRYWWPDQGESWPSQIDEASAAARLRALVVSAVQKRRMSDVPVGCLLSGGIDSSANVAVMSQLMDRPLQTFSAAFPGFGPDQNFHDLPYARLVAQRFGTDHQEVPIGAEQCRHALLELVTQQDEPLGDPACVPMLLLCREARRQGVKVLLVGEGSDEVFGGYPEMVTLLRSSVPRYRRVMRLPRWARVGLHRASRYVGSSPGRVDVLRRAADDEPLYWGLDVVFWETEKDDLFGAAMGARRRGTSAGELARVYQELARRQPGADPLQQLGWVELWNRLPELLLMRVDKLSMAASVEARAPFLDAELVAFGLGLPAHLKIRGAETKYVLKRALEPLLPREIVWRPKHGFRVPMPEWLRGELRVWAASLLFDSPLFRLGLLDRGYVRRMWQLHVRGVADHSFDLWCLLNLTAWYSTWIERREAA